MLSEEENLYALPLEEAENDLFKLMHYFGYKYAKTQQAFWLNKWTKIRDYLIEQNQGLIHSFFEMRQNGRSYYLQLADDIKSDLQFNMLQFIHRFDPWKINPQSGKPYKFSSYAYKCFLSIPIRTKARLQQSNKVDFEEVDFNYMVDPKTVEETISDKQAIVSSLVGMIFREEIPLDDREKRVFFNLFDFRDNKPMSLKSIGKEEGVTKENIRKIGDKILRRLRMYASGLEFAKNKELECAKID